MKLELVDDDISALQNRISAYADALDKHHADRIHAVVSKMDDNRHSFDDHGFGSRQAVVKSILEAFDKANPVPDRPSLIP